MKDNVNTQIQSWSQSVSSFPMYAHGAAERQTVVVMSSTEGEQWDSVTAPTVISLRHGHVS